jgi:hypothetical protein
MRNSVEIELLLKMEIKKLKGKCHQYLKQDRRKKIRD